MLTVRDVMASPVITVRRDTPLKDVARLLINHGVSGVPVVDERGAVLGVVSEGDFLVKEQGIGEIHHRRLARLFGESAEAQAQLGKVEARTAGEAMTAPAITVAPGSAIRDAAALMTRESVNRLPVVEDDRLVGIVTRADLLRAYLRTDEELERVVRDDVVLRMLWLDPATFDISVKNGEATITGHVERRSTAEIIEHSIRMVPGIVAVHADLPWSMDDRNIRPAERDAVFPYGVR
jgi:CBS domain-containing protein